MAAAYRFLATARAADGGWSGCERDLLHRKQCAATADKQQSTHMK